MKKTLRMVALVSLTLLIGGSAYAQVVETTNYDDGRVYIHGTETSSGSVTSKTTYRSPLELTDPEGNSMGRMDVDLSMSAVHSIGSLFAAIPVLRLTNASPAARLCVAMPKPTLLLLYHKHCIPHASNSS